MASWLLRSLWSRPKAHLITKVPQDMVAIRLVRGGHYKCVRFAFAIQTSVWLNDPKVTSNKKKGKTDGSNQNRQHYTPQK